MPLAPPNPKTDLPNAPDNGRLWSLDVYRGLVMFLLVGEGAAFYHAVQAWDVPWLRPVVRQFEHVAWRGLVFWDLVQPAFMFIVGVAMALSLHKRRQRGEAWSKTARHIGFRCAVLFLLGTGLHCVYADKLVFELWNVLTQLSFTVVTQIIDQAVSENTGWIFATDDTLPNPFDTLPSFFDSLVDEVEAVNAVPEPASVTVLSLLGLALVKRNRRG